MTIEWSTKDSPTIVKDLPIININGIDIDTVLEQIKDKYMYLTAKMKYRCTIDMLTIRPDTVIGKIYNFRPSDDNKRIIADIFEFEENMYARKFLELVGTGVQPNVAPRGLGDFKNGILTINTVIAFDWYY